jgi:DNA-binding SARP family transcriptional activator
MIKFRALGTAEIQTATATLTPSQQVLFGAAIYLLLAKGKPVSRSAIAATLWPKAPRLKQRHRLRQTVLQLKKAGIPVVSDGEAIHVPTVYRCVDLDEVLASPQGITQFSGHLEFLAGYHPEFSAQFQDWVDEVRAKAHASLTQLLLPKLNLARDAGNWLEVDRLATDCLTLDPYNESAVLARAEAFAMRGQKAAAVSMLDSYIAEVAATNSQLALPATLLRRRVEQEFVPQAAPKFITTEPDCVGREREMTVLTQLLSTTRAGRGDCCLLTGEPGIGKTRLSSEVAKFAQLQGALVERVTCKRSDVHQPLSAFVSLVPKLREMPGALGCSQQSLMWLKRLTQFNTSGDANQTEEAATVFTNVRSALFDLFDAVADERPLLLIVDDAQWLDRASAGVFGSMLEWVRERKLFFLFNSRTRETLISDEGSPGQLRVLDLRPLKDEESLAVISGVVALAGVQPQTESYEWLIRTGDGNPFFLQELTKHWLETGQRREVPKSVALVLNERVSRLSVVAQQFLQACAVLGENSNLERIDLLLERAPHELLSAIQELSVCGMLRAATDGNPLRSSPQVRHDLLAIEVLKWLPPASLAFLHRRCGIVIERELLGTSISTSLLRACAFHWHEAGDSRRAYDLAVKCASHLLEIGMAIDAAAALEAALGFCSTLEQQLDVLGRMVHALRLANESKALLEIIPRIRALQDPATSVEWHDDLEIIEFEARRTTESGIKPLFARALSCAYDPSLTSSHRASAAVVALKLATLLADLTELERVYFAVEPLLAEPTVDTRARLQVQVIYHAMCGDLTHALTFARERIAWEKARGTSLQLTNAMSDLAFVLRRTGPEDEVIRVLSEAYEVAAAGKLHGASRDMAARLAAFLVDSGRPGAAQWVDRACESPGETLEMHISFSNSAYQVKLALSKNCIDDAARIVEHDFPWNSLRHRHGWLAAALALRVRVQIAQSIARADIRGDLNKLNELYEITAKLGGQDYEVASLCSGLLYVGEEQNARDLMRDYVSTKRRDCTPYARSLVEVCDILGLRGEVRPLCQL